MNPCHHPALHNETERDEDGLRKVFRCIGCGAVFDHKVLDGKTIAISREVVASPNNYATITLSRTTSPEQK